MRTYTAVFTRCPSPYDGAEGHTWSGPYHMTTNSFREAYEKAELLLQGMTDADPSREYEIWSIEDRTGAGLRREDQFSIGWWSPTSDDA